MGDAPRKTASFRKVRLKTTPTREELAALRLGDVVYLDGLILSLIHISEPTRPY